MPSELLNHLPKHHRRLFHHAHSHRQVNYRSDGWLHSQRQALSIGTRLLNAKLVATGKTVGTMLAVLVLRYPPGKRTVVSPSHPSNGSRHA